MLIYLLACETLSQTQIHVSWKQTCGLFSAGVFCIACKEYFAGEQDYPKAGRVYACGCVWERKKKHLHISAVLLLEASMWWRRKDLLLHAYCCIPANHCIYNSVWWGKHILVNPFLHLHHNPSRILKQSSINLSEIATPQRKNLLCPKTNSLHCQMMLVI